MVLKQSIKYANITNNEVGDYGIYLENIRNPDLAEEMLIVPLDRWIGNPEKMSQQLLSELKVPIPSQTEEHSQSSIRNLWSKVPKDLIRHDQPYA